MNTTRRALLTASLALPLVALVPFAWVNKALSSEEETPPLKRVSLAVHSAQGPHRLSVEVAQTHAQRQKGLMGRAVLHADHGMLFTYEHEQSAYHGFWMYRTLIPLDIAFIDGEGVIVAIKTMLPCESSSPSACRSYAPGKPYRAALEVNAGYFAKRGIAEGDCVTLPGVAGACRSS
ncbi:DUF192 domain-containing protein [Vreelandella massiliensis]|uniref:DUF192 domain-containing protein n=1 Tax=Vreelandella massiliensis TaxID=1816686 RepID=UPI00096A42B9|nr:DUF192 domain-containing protein [Halomonas massiliensis]